MKPFEKLLGEIKKVAQEIVDLSDEYLKSTVDNVSRFFTLLLILGVLGSIRDYLFNAVQKAKGGTLKPKQLPKEFKEWVMAFSVTILIILALILWLLHKFVFPYIF
jgi:hypothetical protein